MTKTSKYFRIYDRFRSCPHFLTNLFFQNSLNMRRQTTFKKIVRNFPTLAKNLRINLTSCLRIRAKLVQACCLPLLVVYGGYSNCIRHNCTISRNHSGPLLLNYPPPLPSPPSTKILLVSQKLFSLPPLPLFLLSFYLV